jgi:N-acetylglucosaminyl-diphospho-decaprenol L-rhamnosyltransferase
VSRVPPPSPPRVTVVIVSYRSAEPLALTVPAVLRELQAGDELIVVDNASGDGTVGEIRRLAPVARVLERADNGGFAVGCNAGAAVAGGDLLVFLNPDAVPQAGWGSAIRRPMADGRGWDAWQALVLEPGAEVVNTAGNVVHFTGVAWAGQAGTRVDGADIRRREVGYLSGACLAIPRERFQRLGGFAESYFLYHEDLDLSLRLRLDGGRIGLEPDARVVHHYEFDKGGYKWRLMERNRWATLLRDWPGPVLAAVAPALVATELAVWAAAAAGGWGGEKARATGETVRALPRLLRERREIQAARRISPRAFAAWLEAEPTSAFLGRAAELRPLHAVLRWYWRTAAAVLGKP